MRNILILITLISGLIFTSLVKNKTRLLEKELLYLDNEINSLNFNLNEASLDFEYLTTPKRISLLVKNFLDENFSYYKESQIKKSIKPEKDLAILKKLKNDNTFTQLSTEKSVNKKSNVAKEIDNRQLLATKNIGTQITEDAFTGEETIKYLAILKKLKNDNTFTQLSTEKSVNKKSNVAKEIDNRQLLATKNIGTQITEDAFTGEETIKYLAILKKLKNDNTFTQLSAEKSVNKKSNVAKEIDNRQLQESKKISVSKKVHNWAGLQIVKSFFGIPSIPVK